MGDKTNRPSWFAENFNASTLKGRANVAKATYGAIALSYITYKLVKKKGGKQGNKGENCQCKNPSAECGECKKLPVQNKPHKECPQRKEPPAQHKTQKEKDVKKGQCKKPPVECGQCETPPVQDKPHEEHDPCEKKEANPTECDYSEKKSMKHALFSIGPGM